MKNPDRKMIPAAEPALTVSYKAVAGRVNVDMFLKLPGLVIITNRHWVIQSCNKTAEHFFSTTSNELAGSALFSETGMMFCQSGNEEVTAALFAHGSWEGKLLLNRADGRSCAFESHIFIQYNGEGQVHSIVFVLDEEETGEADARILSTSESKYRTVVESLSEGVILVNSNGFIEAFNNKAAEILGIDPEQLRGAPLKHSSWNALRQDGSVFPSEEFPAIVSLNTGKELNDVVMGLKRVDGNEIWLSINSRPIFKENETTPDAVVASFKDITSERMAWSKVRQGEMLFRSFMGNSPSLAWVYDESGNLVYANPLFLERLGITEQHIGQNIYEFSVPKVADRIMAMNKKVLASGLATSSEDILLLPDGSERSFLANWFLVPGKFGMMVAGQAIDVTEKKRATEELKLMNERFTYVVNASSDAIWDLDLRTNEIYRSDAFIKISGYAKESIEATLNWWLSKIHPEDRERVNHKIETELLNGLTNWEDEYRFLHADGEYRFILDKGYTIFENNIPIRQVGSMQDITERKKLEAQLLQEQVQKQKLVNQATIQAQEYERNMISAELHDNVNQLLISSRLFIGVARKTPENQDELLEKATNYLLMAVDEIRALSKRMNSKVVSIVGLKESITEITNNMQQHLQIDVELDIDEELSKRLSSQHQLMIFRILQEQTGNIVKHSSATKASITLQMVDDMVNLVIRDNGVGFERSQHGPVKGIGLINIINRVDAYNGTTDIISSPGNGCCIDIKFPISN